MMDKRLRELLLSGKIKGVIYTYLTLTTKLFMTMLLVR